MFFRWIGKALGMSARTLRGCLLLPEVFIFFGFSRCFCASVYCTYSGLETCVSLAAFLYLFGIFFVQSGIFLPPIHLMFDSLHGILLL